MDIAREPDQMTRRIGLYESCMATHERIAAIQTVVERLERRLLGNGQPGEVDIIRGRVDSLEKAQWKTAGVITAVVVLAKVAFDYVVPLVTTAHRGILK